ncbi:hypothetical protein BKA57DRAFT_502091 [Linnemannia elongata]|nr:hypothetical protein BKA57DRAFT_502091 [Linnemannia elongata]
MRPTLPTTMLTISENNILPEVLERNAHFLDPHSSSTRTLSQPVSASVASGSTASSPHSSTQSTSTISTTFRQPRTQDTLMEARLSSRLQRLLECVNLARVTTVIPVPDWRNLELRAIPEGVKEHKSWQDRFDLDGLLFAGGTLTVKTFHSRFSNPRQDFRSLESYAQTTNEPKTQIKTLDLFSSWRIGMRPYIALILLRCPMLERLATPLTRGELNFNPVMRRMIAVHCHKIRYLKAWIQAGFISSDTITALENLLNTGCPRLTSMTMQT